MPHTSTTRLEAGADGFMILGGLLATSFSLEFESSLEQYQLRSKSPTPSAIPRSYYEPDPINGREMAAPNQYCCMWSMKAERHLDRSGCLISRGSLASLSKLCYLSKVNSDPSSALVNDEVMFHRRRSS